MKKNRKLIATFMVLLFLVGIIASTNKKVKAIEGTDYISYSNPISSGTVIGKIDVTRNNPDEYELVYSDGTYKDLVDISKRNWYFYFCDKYGTFYYAESDKRNVATWKHYAIYYYNKDICSSSVQPLILDGKQIYASHAVNSVTWDKDWNIMFSDIAYDDDSGDYKMYPPDFDTLKASFDALNPGFVNPPLPKVEESASPTPVNPSPTSGVPTVSTSPNPGTTSSPLTTVSPSPTPSSGSATTSPTETSTPSTSTKTTVKKSGNTVKVTKGGKTIAKVTFKKSTGVANFNGKKVKNVKQAFIIKKSYNYGYITKKGKFYVMKRTTKKKKSYSGKWKKAVIKGNLATKLKYGSKTKIIIGL